MCNLKDLKPEPCVAIVRDADGNRHRVCGMYRCFAEMYEAMARKGYTLETYINKGGN